MSEIPAPPRNHLRRILTRFAWIGWFCGMIVTAFGFAAPWIPAFDLINEVRPLAVLAALVLVVIAALLREGRLLRPTISLALLQVGLMLLPWARAADNAPNLPPALRLVTFDLGADNSRLDDVADFLLNAHADVVMLQQVSCSAVERLIPKLCPAFPSAVVEASSCDGQALMSKRPWVAVGQVTTRMRRPLLVWARMQLANRAFVLTGVHFSGPLAPNEQAGDIARLQAHLESQGAAHIVAGSFHLTPFAWKFAQLQNAGLGQFVTYMPTSAPSWPAPWPFPAVTTDNVLATQGFARVSITTGPPLGSNHRPLIADIAFLK